MKMIKDGNLTALMRGLIIFLGAGIGAAGLGLDWLPKWASIVMILGGFAAMLLGGLSSRAALIGLR
ncbi:MAG TPA: hypothetical protein DD502_34555, partial [Cupriavidus sp.]|nr:hypothetical protein [Cupriavidus sp.]